MLKITKSRTFQIRQYEPETVSIEVEGEDIKELDRIADAWITEQEAMLTAKKGLK